MTVYSKSYRFFHSCIFRNWHKFLYKSSGSFPISNFLLYRFHENIDYLENHIQPDFNRFSKTGVIFTSFRLREVWYGKRNMQELKKSLCLTSKKSRKHFKPCRLFNEIKWTERKSAISLKLIQKTLKCPYQTANQFRRRPKIDAAD